MSSPTCMTFFNEIQKILLKNNKRCCFGPHWDLIVRTKTSLPICIYIFIYIIITGATPLSIALDSTSTLPWTHIHTHTHAHTHNTHTRTHTTHTHTPHTHTHTHTHNTHTHTHKTAAHASTCSHLKHICVWCQWPYWSVLVELLLVVILWYWYSLYSGSSIHTLVSTTISSHSTLQQWSDFNINMLPAHFPEPARNCPNTWMNWSNPIENKM